MCGLKWEMNQSSDWWSSDQVGDGYHFQFESECPKVSCIFHCEVSLNFPTTKAGRVEDRRKQLLIARFGAVIGYYLFEVHLSFFREVASNRAAYCDSFECYINHCGFQRSRRCATKRAALDEGGDEYLDCCSQRQ